MLSVSGKIISVVVINKFAVPFNYFFKYVCNFHVFIFLLDADLQWFIMIFIGLWFLVWGFWFLVSGSLLTAYCLLLTAYCLLLTVQKNSLSFNSHSIVIHGHSVVIREHTIEWPLFDYCVTIVIIVHCSQVFRNLSYQSCLFNLLNLNLNLKYNQSYQSCLPNLFNLFFSILSIFLIIISFLLNRAQSCVLKLISAQSELAMDVSCVYIL